MRIIIAEKYHTFSFNSLAYVKSSNNCSVSIFGDLVCSTYNSEQRKRKYVLHLTFSRQDFMF